MSLFLYFSFNDPPTTEIYTLSLHDALPISIIRVMLTVTLGYLCALPLPRLLHVDPHWGVAGLTLDRKSTRLNSSHLGISYAVFCLKKKIKYRKRKCNYYTVNNNETTH